MKKYIYAAIALALPCFNASAQRAYNFSKDNGTYTELTQAKRISFAQMDSLSGFYRLDELKGETFVWYKTKFTIDTIKTFHIQPYANVRFDNDSTLIIVDAGFTYLDSIDANSAISYVIEGTVGNRIVKTQWKNLKVRVGQASNFVNMQIWVYQKSGVIEIHYGNSSSNNQSGFNVNTGPQVGMFFSRDDFTKCYEKLWVTGSPSSLKLDSLTNYNFLAMSGVPVNGTIFRFTPRFSMLNGQRVNAPEQQLRVYPNPVSGDMLFSNMTGAATIWSVTGVKVIETASCGAVDIGCLRPGLYQLRTASGQGVAFYRR